MPVVIRRNFGPLAKTTLWTQQDWKDVGDALVLTIRRRTLAGKDAEGRAFASYSPAYAAQRQAAGMSTTPNLHVSGEMLNAMRVLDATARSVTIGWVR